MATMMELTANNNNNNGKRKGKRKRKGGKKIKNSESPPLLFFPLPIYVMCPSHCNNNSNNKEHASSLKNYDFFFLKNKFYLLEIGPVQKNFTRVHPTGQPGGEQIFLY